MDTILIMGALRPKQSLAENFSASIHIPVYITPVQKAVIETYEESMQRFLTELKVRWDKFDGELLRKHSGSHDLCYINPDDQPSSDIRHYLDQVKRGALEVCTLDMTDLTLERTLN